MKEIMRNRKKCWMDCRTPELTTHWRSPLFDILVWYSHGTAGSREMGKQRLWLELRKRPSWLKSKIPRTCQSSVKLFLNFLDIAWMWWGKLSFGNFLLFVICQNLKPNRNQIKTNTVSILRYASVSFPLFVHWLSLWGCKMILISWRHHWQFFFPIKPY